MARVGLPTELRIHDLRHSFASLFLLDGGDIFKLSRILGHSSVKTTEIYLGLSLEREQRNELIAGQVMFPSVRNATVIPLREVNGGYRG